MIAEDLGTLDEKVFDLMDETGYPGMKVLQFAFDSGNTNFYLPHRYKKTASYIQELTTTIRQRHGIMA